MTLPLLSASSSGWRIFCAQAPWQMQMIELCGEICYDATYSFSCYINLPRKVTAVKWFDKLNKTWPLPADAALKRSLNEKLYHNILATHRLLLPLIALCQILMLLSMADRPGGLWATWRRSGYVLSYTLLLAVSILMLALNLWFGRKSAPNGQAYLWCNTLFCALFCLWGCVLTLLDQLGSNGLTVYIYVLLILAVMGYLHPLAALAIFGASFVLLNALLPYFPWPSGLDQSFSNLCNSSFICLFAIIISATLHRQRLSGYYQQHIIHEQYEQICAINAQLKQDIIIDPLTGLYNRRYLEQLSDRFDTLRQNHQQLAMLLIDIDYFKQYNDRFGHQAGDECLRQVAEALRRSLLPIGAQAIRYGGEEFAVFLTDDDARQALTLAQKLCQDIQNCRLISPHAASPVTISIGVCIRSAEQTPALNTLIAQADLALYQAKANGRNQAALSPQPPQT